MSEPTATDNQAAAQTEQNGDKQEEGTKGPGKNKNLFHSLYSLSLCFMIK